MKADSTTSFVVAALKRENPGQIGYSLWSDMKLKMQQPQKKKSKR